MIRRNSQKLSNLGVARRGGEEKATKREEGSAPMKELKTVADDS